MIPVYLGLGSNLGDKKRHLNDAVAKIEERIGRVISLSAFYATAPWGFSSANRFLNAALCVATELPPLAVLEITQQIERELGRTAKSDGGSYADRVIDIDLLLYGEERLTLEALTIPHPLMSERNFVLEPLAEIAPSLMHPQLQQTIGQLLAKLHERTQTDVNLSLL